jgi:hypothetical protein
MTAPPKLAPEQQLTIEEFLAFTDTRPEGERWELIEGVAVLDPSPVDALALPAPGLSVPVADIYRWTPLGQGADA